jgi:hypothetical protein
VTRWIAIGAIVVAVWLASFPDLASTEENCQAMPAGPARTDGNRYPVDWSNLKSGALDCTP